MAPSPDSGKGRLLSTGFHALSCGSGPPALPVSPPVGTSLVGSSLVPPPLVPLPLVPLPGVGSWGADAGPQLTRKRAQIVVITVRCSMKDPGRRA